MNQLFSYEFRILELNRMGSESWCETERLSDLTDQGWQIAGMAHASGTILLLLRRRHWRWKR